MLSVMNSAWPTSDKAARTCHVGPAIFSIVQTRGGAGIRRGRGAEQMESAAVLQNTRDFTNAISSVESVCNQPGDVALIGR